MGNRQSKSHRSLHTLSRTGAKHVSSTNNKQKQTSRACEVNIASSKNKQKRTSSVKFTETNNKQKNSYSLKIRGKFKTLLANAEEVFHEYDLDGNGKDNFDTRINYEDMNTIDICNLFLYRFPRR